MINKENNISISSLYFYSTREKLSMGISIGAALAAIAIGVTALVGIAAHNLGPFHALTSIEPAGAWTLIGVGTTILIANILYSIRVHLKTKQIDWLDSTDTPHYFKAMEEQRSWMKNTNHLMKELGKDVQKIRNSGSQEEYFLPLPHPCPTCSQETCHEEHTHIVFVLQGDNQRMMTIRGTINAYNQILDTRFNEASMIPTHTIVVGFNWSSVEKFPRIDKKEQNPLTEEVVKTLAAEFKILLTEWTSSSKKIIKSMKIEGFHYILLVDGITRNLFIYKEDDPKIATDFAAI